MRSAARLEAFFIKQGVLFFARLQCSRRVRRRARAIARLICQSLHDNRYVSCQFNYYMEYDWTINDFVQIVVLEAD